MPGFKGFARFGYSNPKPLNPKPYNLVTNMAEKLSSDGVESLGMVYSRSPTVGNPIASILLSKI